MFHVELRQFPHVARAFNLTGEELDARILRPWLAGGPLHFNERRWDPDRARLTIYEGPRLRTDQLGLGRGWAEVTRTGTDVRDQVLARARADERSALAQLREKVLSRCAEGPLALEEIIELAGEREAAEHVVIDLLHDRRIRIVADR